MPAKKMWPAKLNQDYLSDNAATLKIKVAHAASSARFGETPTSTANAAVVTPSLLRS